MTRPELAHIGRMEAIHILFWRDGKEHLFFIDMGWKRQLDQNPMPVCILIIGFNQGQELFFCCRFRQSDNLTLEASSQSGPLLIADIDLTSRIFSHQYHYQTRNDSFFFLQLSGLFSQLSLHFGRKCLPINQCHNILLHLFLYYTKNRSKFPTI